MKKISAGKLFKVLYTTLSLTLFILVWYLYIRLNQVPTFILPTPVQVFEELIKQFSDGEIWTHLLITLFEVIVGFSIAVILGMLMGYVISKNKQAKELFMPLLVFFQVMPKIALVPIFIIWFGLGMTSKLFVVVAMSFFPIIEGVIEGLIKIPNDFYDLLKTFKSTKMQVLTKLELPFILPTLLPALKVGVIQAIIGATVAEWMAGQYGLGYIQTFASSTFNTSLLITGVIITILLGIVLYSIIDLVERRTVLTWQNGVDEK
ncbi:ABC transporter permease [Amphibacillus sp. Q70]|uniref:ABC transporter permease n=1 Tax=Amphibacillus sp. Q70 TaxID=3453416 RepID=UPI003F85B1C0